MLLLALLAQLAQSSPDTRIPARDSAYATSALREFVDRAARENRAPPASLAGYTATLETELTLVIRDTLGREIVGQVEQLAARAEWSRDGRYELHVVGYRAQNLAAPYSALTFTKTYSLPTLYGNRLYLGMNDGIPRTARDTARDTARRRQAARRDSSARLPPYRAVHPLAADRERYYRFTGGDTIAVVRSGDRVIRLVRVFADPVNDPRKNFAGFRGELDFDADRYQLVRMRGRFVSVTATKDPLLVRSTGAVAVAYMEFENAEIGGRVWLPTVQRSEFQAQMAIMGDVRPIYRIVTRFRDFHLRDTTIAVADGDSLPDLPALRTHLTFAGGDTTSRYDAWAAVLGAGSGGAGADDFIDLAPDVWRQTGRPRFDVWPRKVEDVARYNRVEGAFTGVAGELRFRDMAPGLAVRGVAGWAWSEKAARGTLTASLARAHWITSVRAERALVTTNDFPLTLESGLGIGPLLSGVDEHDYLDRRTASLSVTRIVKNVDRALVTTEVAWVSDRPEAMRVPASPLWDTAYRANRNAAPGAYGRFTQILEVHPSVTGDALSPGLGARLMGEVASGNLNWQRAEVRLAARRYFGQVMIASRLDGGAVFGRVLPPQVMYELGGGFDLPSYSYKEFGGDRAALGRALVAYAFPVMRTPRRVWRLIVPGLSPGIGTGIQGGWAEASSPAARDALLRLGGDGATPLSRATNGVRATADVRFTILSGVIGAGFARPIDQSRRWKPFFMWGAAF